MAVSDDFMEDSPAFEVSDEVSVGLRLQLAFSKIKNKAVRDQIVDLVEKLNDPPDRKEAFEKLKKTIEESRRT